MEGSETIRGKDEREAARLAAIDHLGAVRAGVDRVLQELVDDLREAFGADLCMVNLVLSDVQYFKAWSGELPEELAEARQDLRERSMCQYAVETKAPLVVEDFAATKEFKDHYACVKYGVRFYAGAPLITSEGYAIGSLCLVNGQPKEVSEEQMSLLTAFGRAVVGQLDLLGALVREQDAKEDEAQHGRELQRTLNSSRDMIATLDVNGIFKRVNPACATILGYEPAELVGRGYMDLVHPDDRGLSASLTTAIEDGEAEVRFENRCLRKDGRLAWIEWSATPVREEGVAYCVARDVTERRRAEEKLREAEQLFRGSFRDGVGRRFQNRGGGSRELLRLRGHREPARSAGSRRPDLLTELVELFLSDVSSRLANLREAGRGRRRCAIRGADSACLEDSCGNMGASRMAAACWELQEVGASGDLARARELLEWTEAEFERVRAMLEAETAGS